MQFNLTSKNLVITPAIEAMMNKKLAKLEKFFSDDTRGTVFMSMNKELAKIEITVPVKSNTIRCEQTGNDLYALMDDAVDAMERQLRKYRGKLIDFYQSGAPAAAAPEEAAESEEETIRIVKTKRFAVKPMDPVEACLQMELIGHSFYMFLNSETNEVNVVYRRNDGAYGLIEPVPYDED